MAAAHPRQGAADAEGTLGVLHGHKLELYLFSPYGGGSRVWDESVMAQLARHHGEHIIGERRKIGEAITASNPDNKMRFKLAGILSQGQGEGGEGGDKAAHSACPSS